MPGITELTQTELLNLTPADVLERVRTGEWGIEQFTQWTDDVKNYSWGDGYDEGYETAEHVTVRRGMH